MTHPIANWLYLPPHEQKAALDKVLALRDTAPNPLDSGLPIEAIKWFYKTELPRLAKRPEIYKQVVDRIDELVIKQSEIATTIKTKHKKEQSETVLALQAEVKKPELAIA
jgi:hypothetical protein